MKDRRLKQRNKYIQIIRDHKNIYKHQMEVIKSSENKDDWEKNLTVINSKIDALDDVLSDLREVR